jgi:hypothetical protein
VGQPQYQHFYKLMLCGEGVGWFQKQLKEYLAEQMEAKIRALSSPTKRFTVPPALQAQFLAGAVISLLAWWLEQGRPHSPERMAQYVLLLQRTPHTK